MRTYNQINHDIEKKIFNEYLKGNSSIKISNIYNIHFSTVLKIVKRLGGIVRSTKETSKKYSFDENFFENINTEEKAYWLGFIIADGCICRNDIIIALSESDKSHLQKFIKSINGNNKIQTKNVKSNFGIHGISRLSIRSKKMYNDLLNLGITPNKSLSVKIPIIKDSLQSHLWRGIVDGDGSLGIGIFNKNNRIYKYLNIGLTGNQYVIDSFIEFIENKFNFKTNRKKDKSVWRVRLSGIAAKKICELLYKNSVIYLNRKKEIYENINFT